MVRALYAVTLALAGAVLVMVDAPDEMLPATVDAVALVTSAPSATPFEAPPSAEPTPSATGAPQGRDIAGARVVIARLGIDLPLEWGDVDRDVPRPGYAGATPERVALVFPGSALPGAGGNTYIYSHARVGMFLPLWNVKVGDSVVLAWPDGELRYEVVRIVPRVVPTDTSWLDPQGPERITLQTSTGPYASDPRFVAVAVPVVGQ